MDERGTLLFNIIDGTSVSYQDEGDDNFFEPTVKDVTLVLRDLKNSRWELDTNYKYIGLKLLNLVKCVPEYLFTISLFIYSLG